MPERFSTSLEANGPKGITIALGKAARLLAAVSDTPRLDAELLLAHALGITREALLLGPCQPVPAEFENLLQRRLVHEPVAYITGAKSFWTLDLQVAPGVLIPRPDSETLIEAAVAHFGARAPAKVLDLGTGSGALLLAALDQWPDAWGLGVDRSVAALTIARGNAHRLGFGARAAFLQGDWADAIDARFDLVLCNPPYIEATAELPADVVHHEPASALFAGADGFDAYRRLAPMLARLIAPGGMAAIEIGSTQRETVSALIQVGDLEVDVRQDLANRDRCLVVTRT